MVMQTFLQVSAGHLAPYQEVCQAFVVVPCAVLRGGVTGLANFGTKGLRTLKNGK